MMTNFYKLEDGVWTINDVLDVFQYIKPADLEVLTIHLHNKQITFESQMQSFYRNKPLEIQPSPERGYTTTDAKNDFLNDFFSIFYGTQGKILLGKIKMEDHIVTELLNLENWQDATKHTTESTNTGLNVSGNTINNDHTNITDNDAKIQLEQTDHNSAILPRNEKGELEKLPNPNFFNKNTTKNKNTVIDTTTSKSESVTVTGNNSDITTKTFASNTSKDLREIIDYTSGNLRRQFLQLFEVLFSG